MKTIMQRTIDGWTTTLQSCLAAARRVSLATLCGLLLVSGSLAQEQRPEPLPMPEQPTPESSTKEKPPDPNETVTPRPLASQVVDGDLIFTSPGAFTYTRDIRLSDNFGGLRFYGANSLTTQPEGAAIQFFGGRATPFAGQLYLDSGALDSAALIFRTAPSRGTITERMRVSSDGNVVIGTTNTTSARLYVFTNTSNETAVYGLSGSGFGVTGESFGGDGVYGASSSGSGVTGFSRSGVGVQGSSITGLAGKFFGNVQITGTLSKGGGSFKIDHPLDPTNKYLSHSFVESPDMMNIYNGNVTTDAKGQAVVTLPDYFTALNRDYRYQLTVIGQFAQAIVASKIKNNRFRIKTNKPRVEVSWQVTGIRQDAYAEAHRIRVEEEKTGEERGTYLHPEAFGQPKEKGVARAQQPESNQPLTAASVQRKEN